jgi:hypothetical protein
MRIPANDDVDSLLSGVCHHSFLEDQPMDLGVLGLEQCCRECSIRLLITGVEQRIEQRPREIVHFGQLWVRLALGLFAVAFLIGAVYLSRIGTRLQRLALGDQPTGANEGSTLLDRWLLGYGMVLVVLLIALWDMVFKPGL